jgi:signal peptidase II
MSHSKQVSARGLLILLVMAICVTADQTSKSWVLANLEKGLSQPFIPGFIQLTLTSNPGAAFSIGSQNGQIMGLVATVLTLLISGWIVKRVVADAPLPVVEQIGMGCLIGGAIGNLIDRYTRGLVTDFLEFTFVSFPVFNVADALIDVGIVCLFIAMYFYKTDDKKTDDSTHTTNISTVTESVSENRPETDRIAETSSNQAKKQLD